MNPETETALKKFFGWCSVLLAVPLLVVVVMRVFEGGIFVGGIGSSGEKAMNINVLRIGGWNVWWFIAFWMLSQCILVHHARRRSKQQG